jgi:hypothetical protein
VNEKVRKNRRFTISELYDHVSEISPSLFHETVREKLGNHERMTYCKNVKTHCPVGYIRGLQIFALRVFQRMLKEMTSA